MENSNSYSVLVLEEPITLPDQSPIWGFVIDKLLLSALDMDSNKTVHQYVEYLVGVKEWMDSGLMISKDGSFWYDSAGKKHSYKRYERFCSEAYQRNPIQYKVFNTNKLSSDALDESLIIKNIMED